MKLPRLIRIGIRFVEQYFVLRRLEKLGLKNNMSSGELLDLIIKKESEKNETE
nr:MAG: hypothetical protein [Microvirus Sku111]